MKTLLSILLSFLVISSCSKEDRTNHHDRSDNRLFGVWKRTPQNGDTTYVSWTNDLPHTRISEPHQSFSSNGINLTWSRITKIYDIPDSVVTYLSSTNSYSFYTEGNYIFYEYGSEMIFDDPYILEYNIQDNVLTINDLDENYPTSITYEKQ